MIGNLSDTAKAAIFYAITLALALIAAIFFSDALGEATGMLTMVTPTIGLLVMLLTTREGQSRAGWLSLGVMRAGFRLWWLAILGPTFVLATTYGLLIAAGMASLHAPEVSRSAADTAFGLALSLAMGMVLAFTEEVGWRGYMLPRLAAIGLVPAMLIVGLAQGIWHLPLMLLTPFYHSGGSPIIVVPLFLITLTLAGIFYGCLRIWTGSVWPVAIAHAVYNFVWNVGSEFVAPNAPETMEYIGGESGLLVIAALALAAVAMLPRLRGATVSPIDQPVMP